METEGETVIVIVNDESGKVAVDEELLKQIISSEENSTMSIVHVNDNVEVPENVVAEQTDFPSDEKMEDLIENEQVSEPGVEPVADQINSLLNLDEEEIKKIEHALQSQEADELLGETFPSILEQGAELDDLLDPELSGVPDPGPIDDHSYSAPPGTIPVLMEEENSGFETDSSLSTSLISSGRSTSPKRRSQRQIDRLEREQLEKIRAENEQMLKKEKEMMSKKDEPEEMKETKNEEPKVEEPKQPPTRLSALRQEMQQKILVVEPLKKPQPSVTATQRPKRERKVPKHLREAFEEFEGTPEYLRKLITSTPVSEEQISKPEQEIKKTKLKENKGNNEEEKRKKRTSEIDDNGEKQDEEEEEDSDDESGESWNSDDDPEKLWCVCRKPHNNRFMICCDKCEDWFHGHCVGVTRAMGRQMEEKGLEWICPRCAKSENRKTDSPQEKSGSGSSEEKTKPEAETGRTKPEVEKRNEETAGRKCIISSCKNLARPSSIYCSDSCIIAHARDSLAQISKAKTNQEKSDTPATPTTPKSEPIKLKDSAEFSKLMSQATPTTAKSKTVSANPRTSLPEDYHVTVLDRKTGKILRDAKGPRVAELESWLKKNPTYEVVKPGISPGKFYRPTQTKPKMQTTLITVPALGSSGSSGPSSSQKIHRRKSSVETVKEEKSLPDPETMRLNARHSLKEALWSRCKDLPDSKITEDDLSKLADEIEIALYRYFNKDIGTKYKARYRSLLFNIKDTKNHGLFRKIAERRIKPNDLVKMTAEELASKELAEWREREAKHQLEMIKKTELELVTMSKKYNVVKTHKGEEIIEETGESKAEDRGIVVEPVTEILQDTTAQHKTHMFDLNCKICTGKEKEKESREKSDKHREKDKHKDKDRRRHESSSSKHKKKDKERDKDRERRHDKERSKEKDREKEKDKDRRSRDDERKRDKEKERERRHSHHKHSEKDKEKSDRKKEEKEKKEEAEADKEEKKEEIKMEVQEEEKEQKKEETLMKEEAREEEMEEKKEKEMKKENEVEKQEPTSTVNIKTPEIENSPTTQGLLWTGIVNSSDVGKFAVQAYEMIPNVDLSDTLTKDSLDIVGRIPPQLVWDYIMQTRKVASRDIVLVHFQPKSDGDKKFYNSFLSHMYKSNRFAVVGPVSKIVKDFYIVPLPKDSPIPTVLTALASDSPVLDENRTSILIGIIVRSRGKVAGSQEPKAEPKTRHVPRHSRSESKVMYIPTSKSSTKRKTAESDTNSLRRAKAARPSTEADDQVPYSPSQLLEEDDEPKADNSHQLTLKELDSKIEQQKSELLSLAAKVSPKDVMETLIPGLEPVIPGLEPSDSLLPNPKPEIKGISIPNNLQEILSAIQQKEEELTKLSRMVEHGSHGSRDVDLRDVRLSSTGDVDMRQIPQAENAIRDPRRKSLNQLSDEELLAKAMEMESVNRPFPGGPPHPHGSPMGPQTPFYGGPYPIPEPPGVVPPGPMHPMGPMMGPRPPLPPYGPGFPPHLRPYPPQGPGFWGPPRPGPMPPRGSRPR